jgi:hypothetical protein
MQAINLMKLRKKGSYRKAGEVKVLIRKAAHDLQVGG